MHKICELIWGKKNAIKQTGIVILFASYHKSGMAVDYESGRQKIKMACLCIAVASLLGEECLDVQRKPRVSKGMVPKTRVRPRIALCRLLSGISHRTERRIKIYCT